MSDRIRFVLDGAVKELSGIDPTLTVLRYLREVERRSGTKEGCAEGDCGACTVVLGELHRGELRYRAVNACILFVPALDGKALLTVESVRGPGGELHPVQRAMVDCHASQCGFCTPGFVMSLVALYESEPEPSRQRLDDVLAGNLCRCTGYRPIVDAGRQAYQAGEPSALASQRAALTALLTSIQPQDTLSLEHDGRRFFAPRSLAALGPLLAEHPGAHLLAGGTDVGLWVTKAHRNLDTVISLSAVEELGAIARTRSHLEIGAAVTYADAHAALAELHPDLGELVRRIGSLQVRNAGTLGGNIANASPIGDTLPALLALDASLVLQGGSGRREVALDGFFTGYRATLLRAGEVIVSIRVPLLPPGRLFRAYKISKRFDQDISAVCGAFALNLDGGRVRDVRLCYGGVASTPFRARATERALTGRAWDEAALAAALPVLDGELAPISDARASARYRRLVAGNLLRKLQLETAAQGALPPAATRVLERGRGA